MSTHRVEYPKPGKPVYHPTSIQEDLRRRDFTVNSMAISLNEGSFGLLMDPLNGAADIELRTLRLVSNYGFLEEPSLLIRATRYAARLSWEMDQRTLARYEYAKSEGVFESISAHARSLELEQIGHEEDGLKVLRALDAEGWMNILFPAWTPARADEDKLKALHDLAVELLMQGVHADMSAAQMQLLTAKLAPKDLNALKKLMLRPGFVEEWNDLDAIAAGFSKALLAKQNSTPSAGFKLFTSYDPEAVLWLGFTSKTAAVRERYEQFLKVWPESRQKIPHALMQEMRITPGICPVTATLFKPIFLELIDGKLTTPEEMRAFLEPHSPPAPPPPVSVKRTRAKRSAEARIKERAMEDEGEDEESLAGDEDIDDLGADDDEIELTVPAGDLDEVSAEEPEEEETEEGEEEETAPAKAPAKKAAAAAKTPKAVGHAAKTAAKPVVPMAEPALVTKTEPKKPAAAGKTAAVPPASKSAALDRAAKPSATKPAAKPDAQAPAKSSIVAKPAAKPAAPAPAAAKKSTPTVKPTKAPSRPAAKPARPAAKKVEVRVPAKSKPNALPAKPARGTAHSAKPAKSAKASKPAPKKPAPKAALKKKKR